MDDIYSPAENKCQVKFLKFERLFCIWSPCFFQIFYPGVFHFEPFLQMSISSHRIISHLQLIHLFFATIRDTVDERICLRDAPSFDDAAKLADLVLYRSTAFQLLGNRIVIQ